LGLPGLRGPDGSDLATDTRTELCATAAIVGGPRSIHSLALSVIGAVAIRLPNQLGRSPHRPQTRLSTASRGRPRTQPPVPSLHTYRPSPHPDRKNSRWSDSNPHSGPASAANASAFLQVALSEATRHEPSSPRQYHTLPGRFRYSSNTSRQQRYAFASLRDNK
jgi:hypothetical protein